MTTFLSSSVLAAGTSINVDTGIVRGGLLLLLVLHFLYFVILQPLWRPTIHRNGRAIRRPPGTLPLAGYGLWFLRPRHTLLTWFAEIAPQMGLETFELPVPSLPPAVLVNSPVVLEQILGDDGTVFAKGAFFRSRTADLFRDGILNADGDLWRAQRKAGLRFLSKSNLRRYIDGELRVLLDELCKRLEAAADRGTIVDLQQELLNLTTAFMGRIAYGMEISSDTPFAKAFENASALVARRFTNPFWSIGEMLTRSELQRNLAEIHSFGARLVAGRQRVREKANEAEGLSQRKANQGNLMDTLLEHIGDTDTVAAAALNFLSAGHDTTAQSMAWTMYCLCRHPKKLARLRGSLNAHFRQPGKGYCIPQYDQVANPLDNPYFAAVFSESLRLFPPIPFEIKEANQAVALSDGVCIPKGAVVIWIPYAMARNPRIWGSDAVHYRPERWFEGSKDDTSQHNTDDPEASDLRDENLQPHLKTAFENPVFNAGPRTCIGRHMAEVLAAVVLTVLVCSFDFDEVYTNNDFCGEKVGADSLTMPILGGLPVIVKRLGERGVNDLASHPKIEAVDVN